MPMQLTKSHNQKWKTIVINVDLKKLILTLAELINMKSVRELSNIILVNGSFQVN